MFRDKVKTLNANIFIINYAVSDKIIVLPSPEI